MAVSEGNSFHKITGLVVTLLPGIWTLESTVTWTRVASRQCMGATHQLVASEQQRWNGMARTGCRRVAWSGDKRHAPRNRAFVEQDDFPLPIDTYDFQSESQEAFLECERSHVPRVAGGRLYG